MSPTSYRTAPPRGVEAEILAPPSWLSSTTFPALPGAVAEFGDGLLDLLGAVVLLLVPLLVQVVQVLPELLVAARGRRRVVAAASNKDKQ